MKYSESAYRTLAERFNKMSFLQKIITVKQQSDLFILEVSDGNLFLRLNDEEAQKNELDMLFSFPQFLSDKEWRDLFSLIDVKLKIV